LILCSFGTQFAGAIVVLARTPTMGGVSLAYLKGINGDCDGGLFVFASHNVFLSISILAHNRHFTIGKIKCFRGLQNVFTMI
jgi:hypothetical protein